MIKKITEVCLLKVVHKGPILPVPGKRSILIQADIGPNRQLVTAYLLQIPVMLLTLYEGNPPVTGGFPTQRASNTSSDNYF